MYAAFTQRLKEHLAQLAYPHDEIALFLERRPLRGFDKPNLEGFLHGATEPLLLRELIRGDSILNEHVIIRLFLGIHKESASNHFISRAEIAANGKSPQLVLCPYAPEGITSQRFPFVLRIPKVEVVFRCTKDGQISAKINSVSLGKKDRDQMQSWAKNCCQSLQDQGPSPLISEAFQRNIERTLINLPREEIIQDILEVQEQILRGNSYLLNYTIRIFGALPASHFTPQHLLEAWGHSQSRFAAYFSHEGKTLMSLSPERFVAIRSPWILTEPIKGTFLPEESKHPEQEDAKHLWDSQKEVLEQTMIVDLLRNDLNRICEPGSVEVYRPFFIGIAGQLLQMQSFIAGRLFPNISTENALKRMLPPGSITGTPKERTCQIIHCTEKTPRGYYCGVFGVVDDRNCDSILLIRSHFSDETGTYLGTGAGITGLSNPELEADEFRVKAKSFLLPFGSAS